MVLQEQVPAQTSLTEPNPETQAAPVVCGLDAVPSNPNPVTQGLKVKPECLASRGLGSTLQPLAQHLRAATEGASRLAQNRPVKEHKRCTQFLGDLGLKQGGGAAWWLCRTQFVNTCFLLSSVRGAAAGRGGGLGGWH